MNQYELIPDYPRTRHLFYKPNAQRLDLIATEEESKIIFDNPNVFIEEKVDGANCGICYFEDNFYIRNRNNFLRKSSTGKTPAKMQFSSIWNWVYENINKFITLNEIYPGVSVYGEWLYALHGIKYDLLPSYFLAYDIYDYKKHRYLPTNLSRELLENCGFDIVPLLHVGNFDSYEFLDKFMEQNSRFSSKDKIEGLYLKVCSSSTINFRFKMIRHDFIQGCHWNHKQLTKNKLKE